METANREPSIAHDLVTLAAAVIVIVGMKLLASILVPVLTSMFFLLAFLPLVGWLQRKGVTPGWSKVITIALALTLLVGIVLLVVVSVVQLAENWPTYQDQLRARLDALSNWLADYGITLSSQEAADEVDYRTVLDVAVRFVPGVISAAAAVLLSLVVFIYALIDIERIRERLSRGLGADNPQLAQLARMVSVVSRYIAIRAVLGAMAAALDVVWLLVLGVQYALFWGFISFIMSFIPYLGYWVAVIPPMLLALATEGWVAAALVFVGYLLINGAIDNLVGPTLMGRGLNLAPAVTVISIVFWGTILGPMGAILALPLTVACKLVLLERSPNSRWLALLLSAGDGTDDGIRPGSERPPTEIVA